MLSMEAETLRSAWLWCGSQKREEVQRARGGSGEQGGDKGARKGDIIIIDMSTKYVICG